MFSATVVVPLVEFETPWEVYKELEWLLGEMGHEPPWVEGEIGRQSQRSCT